MVGWGWHHHAHVLYHMCLLIWKTYSFKLQSKNSPSLVAVFSPNSSHFHQQSANFDEILDLILDGDLGFRFIKKMDWVLISHSEGASLSL
jgi:sensor histidine kinase YesM